MQIEQSYGASPESIQFHYDQGNAFYQYFLDETMSYSCAKWDNVADSLHTAQINKLKHIFASAHFPHNGKLLDIGCGWGGLLQAARNFYNAEKTVGLTLSKQQFKWIEQHYPNIEVNLEDWNYFSSPMKFDLITSVESIEAFVRPDITPAQKLAVYNKFFKRCANWLQPNGYLYLQAICYGNANPEDLDEFIKQSIFPESDLPLLSELTVSCQEYFNIQSVENTSDDYVTTLRCWSENMRRNKSAIIDKVGDDCYERYRHYLKLSQYMFKTQNCMLYCIFLQKK